MTRINTNVSSLVAQNRLQSSNTDLQQSLTRLSTGLRINSGSDDPAGLLASEALRGEITGLTKSISNTQRASQIIGTADSALGQVSNLLNDVRGLVVEAANSGALSDEEVAANQLQIDSSLEAINRIAQTTTFQGRKLLDGSQDFVTAAGNNFGNVTDLNIDQANLGSLGKIDVDVDIKSAATKATASSTGFAATGTSAGASGTITFDSPDPAAEAVLDVALTDSFTVGSEATKSVSFANAYTPNAEATGDIVLDNTDTLTITATDGGAADGEVGNDTDVRFVVNNDGNAADASYDATSNVLTITVDQDDTVDDIVADLGAGTDFTFTGTGTNAVGVAQDNTAFADALAGGSNTTVTASFDLNAVDGGQADGAVGNDTVIEFTTGGTRGATYDSDTNTINVVVEEGDTVAQIAQQINSDLGADFLVDNVSDGGSTFSTAAADITSANVSGATAGAGGTNPTIGAGFELVAVNNGEADGTAGNSATLNFVAGDANLATFDADTNVLTVTVADGATVQDVADAIDADTDGTFLTQNVSNGTALFDTSGGSGDLGTNTPTVLSAGTDDVLQDVITVTSDNADTSDNGVTITLNADNSLAAGTASASVDTDGNIVVQVSSNGPVATGTIASQIDQLDGFSASQTASAGDSSYDIGNDAAAVTTDLADGTFGGGLNDDLVLQLTGATGSEVFQFDKGASIEDVIQSINLVSDSTGIQASNDGGTLKLDSTAYGSDSLVDIEVISEGADGTFEAGLSTDRAEGQDIVATINGTRATGDGNTVSINTSVLDISLTVDEGSSDDVSFSITGGGALFQLGPDVTSNQQARLGIGSVSTGQLGGVNGRLYELGAGQNKSLANDVNGAAAVIEDVVNEVNGLRGRLGAFQATTLESNLVSLNETKANLQEAESSIRDADFAQESANLTRAQILVQSGTNVLSLANQNPRNVLSLLR